MVVDGDKTLNSLINDGILERHPDNTYLPSTKFNFTMEAISHIVLNNISKGEKDANGIVKEMVENPSLLMEGILLSTIVNYSNVHLGKNGMSQDEAELRLNILKEYYEDDMYTKDIKKMKFGG